MPARFNGRNAPNSVSAGAAPQSPLGEDTVLPTPLHWLVTLHGGEELRKVTEIRQYTRFFSPEVTPVGRKQNVTF